MEHVETVIIGAGQAGLSTAYHLKQKGRDCVVLDRNQRVGDGWRQQWDSLRLYSPAKYDGLPGMPFPGNRWSYPGKDDLADYLEAYAHRFDLPVRLGVRVSRVSARASGPDTGFVVDTSMRPVDVRQRRGRDRHLRTDAVRARLREGPGPLDPAAALQRVPPPRPAARGRRPRGGCVPLRHPTSPTRPPPPGRPRSPAATAGRSRFGSSPHG